MIVRIDDLCPPGGVGQDADALGGQPEFPRLRVVPVGGERRHPDQFFQPRIAREKLPLPRHLYLVTVHARPETVSDGTEGKAGSDQGST